MRVGLPPAGLNHNFRLLWAGEGISVLGSMTTTVVKKAATRTSNRLGRRGREGEPRSLIRSR